MGEFDVVVIMVLFAMVLLHPPIMIAMLLEVIREFLTVAPHPESRMPGCHPLMFEFVTSKGESTAAEFIDVILELSMVTLPTVPVDELPVAKMLL